MKDYKGVALLFLFAVLLGCFIMALENEITEEIRTSKDLPITTDTITPQPIIKWHKDTIKCMELSNGIFIKCGKLTTKEKHDLFNHIRQKYKNTDRSQVTLNN